MRPLFVRFLALALAVGSASAPSFAQNMKGPGGVKAGGGFGGAADVGPCLGGVEEAKADTASQPKTGVQAALDAGKRAMQTADARVKSADDALTAALAQVAGDLAKAKGALRSANDGATRQAVGAEAVVFTACEKRLAAEKDLSNKQAAATRAAGSSKAQTDAAGAAVAKAKAALDAAQGNVAAARTAAGKTIGEAQAAVANAQKALAEGSAGAPAPVMQAVAALNAAADAANAARTAYAAAFAVVTDKGKQTST